MSTKEEADVKPQGDVGAEESTRRLRTHTEKMKQVYDAKVQSHADKLKGFSDLIDSHINASATTPNEHQKLEEIKNVIRAEFENYEEEMKELCEYLERENTSTSIDELETQNNQYQTISIKVNRTLDKLEQIMDLLQKDNQSVHGGSTSSSSSKTSKYSERKAEATKVKLKWAEEATAIKRKQSQLEYEERIRIANVEREKAELEAQLALIKIKEEKETLEAEDKVLQDDNQTPQLDPNAPPFQSQNYLGSLNYQPQHVQGSFGFQPQPIQVQPMHYAHSNGMLPQYTTGIIPNYDAFNVSTFLLKKDLVPQRMSKFDDDPSSYMVWKGTFRNVVAEVGANSFEQLDLLLRWLGPQSARQATSIRRANPNDANIALRKIWERLDERYGAPELIDATLRERLQNFPRITLPKDKQRLYELVDILAEVQSIKSDTRYAAMLSYYDTSSGVNPILAKFPPHIQNKWMDRAVRYKDTNRVTFPPFTDLSKFVGLVGQSDIFSKCPTKNARVPDQMSDKNFPTEKKMYRDR
ncbi:hypothetical protein FSP39_017555 [Pinctada imbricata]|uniref:Uncharacterized protein n=1 Tax=Pinctada imbricata TaxID=66713 RepID=A0AA89CBZ0_PINIB|nr:hypothetical protein FSP39_017555 [Pinctada imbricata]